MRAPPILALVTDAFGGQGGIAQYNRDLLTALADATGKPIVVVPRHVAEKPAVPHGVQQLYPGRGRISYSLSALTATLSQRPDWIFCGHLYMAPLGALLAKLTGAKLVVQMHGIEAWRRPSRWQRAAVEAADLVLCVSRYTRGAVLGWGAMAPERVLVVPNTVGEIFVPGDTGDLRRAWGLDGKQILLTVGRMDARERYKGHDLVIHALPYLVAAGRDVHYVIFGDGDDAPRLKLLAFDTGVAERVHFKKSAKSDLLVDAYRTADLFVMPSTGEGFGIAFLESMACGTPALGLDVAGARDALAGGELGVLVREADLSDAILRCLAHPKPDPQRLAIEARQRFGRENFTAGVRHAWDRLSEAA